MGVFHQHALVESDRLHIRVVKLRRTSGCRDVVERAKDTLLNQRAPNGTTRRLDGYVPPLLGVVLLIAYSYE